MFVPKLTFGNFLGAVVGFVFCISVSSFFFAMLIMDFKDVPRWINSKDSMQTKVERALSAPSDVVASLRRKIVMLDLQVTELAGCVVEKQQLQQKMDSIGEKVALNDKLNSELEKCINSRTHNVDNVKGNSIDADDNLLLLTSKKLEEDKPILFLVASIS